MQHSKTQHMHIYICAVTKYFYVTYNVRRKNGVEPLTVKRHLTY